MGLTRTPAAENPSHCLETVIQTACFTSMSLLPLFSCKCRYAGRMMRAAFLTLVSLRSDANKSGEDCHPVGDATDMGITNAAGRYGGIVAGLQKFFFPQCRTLSAPGTENVLNAAIEYVWCGDNFSFYRWVSRVELSMVVQMVHERQGRKMMEKHQGQKARTPSLDRRNWSNWCRRVPVGMAINRNGGNRQFSHTTCRDCASSSYCRGQQSAPWLGLLSGMRPHSCELVSLWFECRNQRQGRNRVSQTQLTLSNERTFHLEQMK